MKSQINIKVNEENIIVSNRKLKMPDMTSKYAYQPLSNQYLIPSSTNKMLKISLELNSDVDQITKIF
jgi:hypothetical protein